MATSVKQLGIFPRLLIVAPAIWLWWLILLYLSLPLRLRDVAVTGGAFWAVLWMLVYGSRLVRTELVSSSLTPEILWLLLSALLLLVTIAVSRDRRTALVVVMCTVVGLVLPILALIGSYSGLLLGLAGLLSLGWLATPQWYGRQRRSPLPPNQSEPPTSKQLTPESELLMAAEPVEEFDRT